MYKCEICGKNYKELEERIQCEMSCLAKRKEDEKKKRELELKKTQETRKAEVDAAYDTYQKLKNAYIKDYGCYSIVRRYKTPTLSDIEKFWSED